MYLTIDSLFEQAVFLVIDLISSLAFPAAMGKPANSNIGKSFLLSPAAIISLLLTPINSLSFESAEHYIDMQTLIRLYNLLSSYDTMIEFYENKEPKTDKSKLNINSYHYYKIDENYIDVIDKTRIGIEDLSSAVDLFDKTELLNVFFKNFDERKNCFEKLKHFDDIIFTTSMTNNDMNLY